MTTTPAPRAALAVAGVLAGLAGLATSQATVWAFGGGDSPLVAVASAIRDFTPGSLAVKLVELVQHLDKPLLVTGTAVGLLVVCGVAGVLTRRHALASDLTLVVLAVIGLAAVVRQDSGSITAGFACVIALVTWIVALRFLTSPYLGEAAPDATRRSFLIRSGSVAVVGAAVAGVGRFAGKGRRDVEEARRLLRLPVTAGRPPQRAQLDVPGVAPWRTPSGGFYRIDTTLSAPSVKPSEWSLRIHGMVDNERTISYQDLVGRRLTQDWITLCCVSNEVGGKLIGNAFWSGVLIRELLGEAGVSPDADAVLQTSVDGWTCGTPVQALTDNRNAMLAIAMNGRPLPVDHGFPVRMVVPGLYGYVSATKWLVDLEVTRFDRFDAYWTERGWAEKGPVKTQSRIDAPRDGAAVRTGSLRVGGSAWAQHTGIEKVEVRLDDGPWRPTELGVVPNVDTWVQWTTTLDVSKGRHTLAVRATDRGGFTQTSERADVVPDGATGWHTIGIHAG